MEAEFLAAAARFDREALAGLLARGADINSQDDDGNTALILALKRDPIQDISRLALAALRSEDGDFDLDAASMGVAVEQVSHVAWLMARGADREITNNAGQRAIDYSTNDLTREALGYPVAPPQSPRSENGGSGVVKAALADQKTGCLLIPLFVSGLGAAVLLL